MDDFDSTTSVLPVTKKAKISNWISSSFSNHATAKDMTKPVGEMRKRKFSRHSSADFCRKDPDKTWLERYAPKCVEELSVHKKKIAEVECWLTQHLVPQKGGAPILLITGPSGCGKTATLMVVAKKHGIQIEVWSNPLTTPYTVTQQAGLKYESQNTQFGEFLYRSGKYPSILKNNFNEEDIVNKLILLEDLPNFVYQDPSCLKDLLRKYWLTQKWPLVLIISDGTAAENSKRHFGDFCNKMKFINFNAISPTLMTKTLNRIALTENIQLSKEDLALISTSGDIRCAINNLQFSSQSATSVLTKFSTCSKTKKDSKPLTAKDTTLILFRALGKVFYCKREKCLLDENKIGSLHRDPLLVQPEDVLDQCCLSGRAFSTFLHENYLLFNEANPINDIVLASDYLSLSDLMNSPITSSDPSSGAASTLDRYEGVLASRGLIYANSQRATADLCSKASGSWRPMHKPAWYQVRKQEQENRLNSHCLFWKQQNSLPYLKYHSDKLNFAQKIFVRDVVTLTKWGGLRSLRGDKLTELEIGADCNETIPFDRNTINIEPKDNHDKEDDDICIEEFSD